MEHQKTSNLLNEASDSRFVTWKWNIINDWSNANYNVGEKIIYSREVLKSKFCDYNGANILVRGDITVVAATVDAII